MTDQNRSADRIAAKVQTGEATMDPRMSSGSEAGHRRDEIRAALLQRGLQPKAFGSGLDRVLSGARAGDVAEIADEMVQLYPAWFTEPTPSTSSRLVEQLRSGETATRRGGIH